MFNQKKDKIIIYVVPQQHWDPFWHFAPEVAERMGLRNLRKALDIMKEEPDFKYTSGQVYLWELFEKHFPARVGELKQRVKEGKIELTNGGYANPDFNLPSGESLIRNLAYAQKVWQKDFGVRPEICWVQDSFGQSGQLPQIFLKLGIKYHTSKRGASRNLPGVFIWEGVDGSRIILDRQPLGHHGIVFFPPFSVLPSRTNPNENLEKILKPLSFPMAIIALYFWDPYIWMSTKGRAHSFRAALKYLVSCYPDNEILVLHGFSADAAMPVAWICYLAHTYTRLSKNDMLISLPSTFFKSLENKLEKLTVVRGELNGPTGKRGEAFGALPGTYSARIDVKQRARHSERLLYLTEFLEALRFIKKGRGEDLTDIWKLKFLNDFHDGICGSLTDDNYFFLKEKAELLIHRCIEIMQRNLELLAPKEGIFNPLSWSRKDLVEIENELKLIEAEPSGFSQLKTVTSDQKFVFEESQKTLITPFYQVKWRDNNLEIYQNSEKITGEKFCRLRLQRENGDTYFWDVSGEEWNDIKSIELVGWQGPRATLKIISTLHRIKTTQLIYFYLHTPRVDFVTTIDNKNKNIRLQVHLPFEILKKSEVIREIPAGFIREGESSGQASWAETFSALRLL